VQLYTIQLRVSNFPCDTHTKSNWKWILKYVDCYTRKRICNCSLFVVHMQSSKPFLMGKIVSIIIHIITGFFLLNGKGMNCEGRRYLFYFSMIFCSLAFWFTGSMSYLTVDKQFIKKKIFRSFFVLFCKIYHYLYKTWISMLSLAWAVFNTWHC
jgi:hypothetical protein